MPEQSVVHITGTSSGLGHALAVHFGDLEGCSVFGYSRRPVSGIPNYTHREVNLCDSGSRANLNLAAKDADRAVLINNAGWIDPVAPIGRLGGQGVSNLLELNTGAVFDLTNRFITQTEGVPHRVVITISSGAAQYPIPSWSVYCASKAAVDMATKVWAIDRPDVHFFSIAPGLVDTEMQAVIRSKSESEFPDVERFVQYHETGSLQSPVQVARQIAEFALNPERAPGTVFSVRDL